MPTRARGERMNLILMAFLAMNLIFIATFVIAKCFIFKLEQSAKLQAHFSLVLGFLFLFYFISIIGVVGISLLHHKYLPLCLIGFIVIPFVIGQKATYKKIRFYSNLQLAMFFLSLLASFLLIK